MRSIILGDPHLSKGLSIGKTIAGSGLNSRIADQIKLLDWTLDKAIEYNVHSIIITGDIFEEPKPHPSIITIFGTWLKKCTDTGIEVHCIQGNHDILRNGQFYTSALDMFSSLEMDGIYVHKKISSISMDGLSLTFMPFRDRRSFNIDSNTKAIEILSSKLPYELSSMDTYSTKVLIGHLALEGSIPVGDEIDDMNNELYCPLSMFNGYDFVWMGHVHKPQVLNKSPYVAHIGSMDLSDFGEADTTKIIALLDTKNPSLFEYIDVPSRPLKKISISVPDNVVDTTEYVMSQINGVKLSKAIVKLDILANNIHAAPIDRAAVEKLLSSSGAFHIAKISEDRKVSPIKKPDDAKIETTIDDMSAIKLWADLNIDEDSKSDFVFTAKSVVEEAIIKED